MKTAIAAAVLLLGGGPATVANAARNPKKGISFSGAQSCSTLEPHTDSSWWYTWGARNGFSGTRASFCPDGDAPVAAARESGMDFVPMFWSSVPDQPLEAGVASDLQAARYLMTFNEPEREDQANLDPAFAASEWSKVEAIADEHNLEIVGPCMTKDAYEWYDAFTAACEGCRIDYTCIHTYYQPWPCDGSKNWECIGNAQLGDDVWLRQTIDKWYNRYGEKPIWVTEYGCYPWDAAGEGCDADKHSAIMDQQTAVFEEDARVFRYNWFTSFAFDEGGFKDGALNVPNWDVSPGAQGCANMEWIAGMYSPSKPDSWRIKQFHECVSIADANSLCHQPLRLSIDDESCYCSRDACETTVTTWGAMNTYSELDLLAPEESALTAIGEQYNAFSGGPACVIDDDCDTPPNAECYGIQGTCDADADTCSYARTPKGFACTITSDGVCDASGNCVECAQDVDCDDSNVCNGAETCSGGQCLSGTALTCNDGKECTTDTCDPVSGCVFTSVEVGTPCQNDGTCDGSGNCVGCIQDGDCGNSNVCDGVETCSNGQCVSGAALICDDGNDCTANACDPISGCAFANLPSGTACQGGTCDGSGNCNSAPTCDSIANKSVCNETPGCGWSGSPSRGSCSGNGGGDDGGGGECGTKPSGKKCRQSSDCASCECLGSGVCS